MVRYQTLLFTRSIGVTLLFGVAKLFNLQPLVDWSWVWVFSPIWMEWLTIAIMVTMSQQLDRAVRAGEVLALRSQISP